MTDDIECVRCGESFESYTQRTMHVIRKRCPEIDDEEDADSADTLHAFEEMVRSIKEGDDIDEKLDALDEFLPEDE